MSKLVITIEGFSFEVELNLPPDNNSEIDVQVNGMPLRVVVPDRQALAGLTGWLMIDDRSYEVTIDRDFNWVRSRWGIHSLEIQNLEIGVGRPPSGNGRIKAPIPGQVTHVLVSVGDEVQTHQPLLVLEAMKMENEIRSPRAGVVRFLNVFPGQSVALGEVLAEIE